MMKKHCTTFSPSICADFRKYQYSGVTPQKKRACLTMECCAKYDRAVLSASTRCTFWPSRARTPTENNATQTSNYTHTHSDFFSVAILWIFRPYHSNMSRIMAINRIGAHPGRPETSVTSVIDGSRRFGSTPRSFALGNTLGLYAL